MGSGRAIVRARVNAKAASDTADIMGNGILMGEVGIHTKTHTSGPAIRI